ncbi:YbaK/EbsC family protein [Halocynthiibacter styelae]|uniref:YbaK/EbsC family protein n=1 Tax=Halocynthiibacter styelae TaxID=2761955 RepID=A0A8J7ITM1_9RHOB|nr:YbaK/EbsC family protein [Paenihalocynthiibacter styelae]MBI1492078.1 YbaK/EbsC family protein [Paenihalocynthiibacter styelae]
MSKSLKRVRAALEDAGVVVEIVEMSEGTRTAAEAAAAAGCEIDQIAKSIIFAGAESGGLFLFITAGGNQVDPVKASALAGEELVRADAGEVRKMTGFAIGGVSPVGHLTAPTTFFDKRLSDFDVVWAAAGTPRHIFAIRPAVLSEITKTEQSDFTS